MNAMNMPGFTAETSLYHASEHYHMSQESTGSPNLVVPQLRCPCPAGLLNKASRLCPNPEVGGQWCAILSKCLDCFDN